MEPEALLAEITEFCAETGMSPSAFGAGAIGDDKLVAGLRGGRECRLRTVRRIRDFIAANRVEQAQA